MKNMENTSFHWKSASNILSQLDNMTQMREVMKKAEAKQAGCVGEDIEFVLYKIVKVLTDTIATIECSEVLMRGGRDLHEGRVLFAHYSALNFAERNKITFDIGKRIMYGNKKCHTGTRTKPMIRRRSEDL
ncbi:hypothetical protein RND71_015802 [Anisodus tanguticus]|uniref:Uncharacterized protein n=1 Tax=Anisodus tanguticus TaxID=243964 RepID=A0AAE1S7J0_9SOLA|nr:hypothetical protein RND71_015802 [Anisodus tanguticus]